MHHRLSPLPYLIVVVSLAMLVLGAERAPGQTGPTTVTYATGQPPRTWNTRPGALEFEGRALRREGDYVAFETTGKLHIWLPLRYLSEQNQTYLNALGAASSPLTLDVARPQVDTGPGGFGAPTEMITPNPAATNPAPSHPAATAAMPSEAAPADNTSAAKPNGNNTPGPPTSETTPQTYKSRQLVEVRVNGQWFQGTVFAENPAQRKYFVSYRENNAPRSGWIEVEDIRAVEEEAVPDELGEDAP